MLKESLGDSMATKEFFANILELFQTDVGEVLDRMEKLKSQTIVEEEIIKIVHFIAGSASNIGLRNLAFVARDYESAIKDDLPFDYSMGELVNELQKSFRESIAAYQRMIEAL